MGKSRKIHRIQQNQRPCIEFKEKSKKQINKHDKIRIFILKTSFSLFFSLLLGLVVRGANNDDEATLDDLREAVNTLEETTRTARRVFGGAHPLAAAIKKELRFARPALSARETPP